MAVEFQPAGVGFRSACGRFTIVPASVARGKPSATGFVLADGNGGGTRWHVSGERLKGIARELVAGGLRLVGTQGAVEPA